MHDCKKKKDQCFIETHSAYVYNEQICDGRTLTYFEDFTKNHNKAMIEVDIENADPGCMVTAIIETRDGKTIERPIPLDSYGDGERAFQVEDVCRVSLRGESHNLCAPPVPASDSNNSYQPLSTFEAWVDIEKTFCICCPNDKEDKHHCDRCGSADKCGCSRKRLKYEDF